MNDDSSRIKDDLKPLDLKRTHVAWGKRDTEATLPFLDGPFFGLSRPYSLVIVARSV
jgi:hypothetical protein